MTSEEVQRLLVHALGPKSQKNIKRFLSKQAIPYRVVNEEVVEIQSTNEQTAKLTQRYRSVKQDEDGVLLFDHKDSRSRPGCYRCYSHRGVVRGLNSEHGIQLGQPLNARALRLQKQKGSFLATELAQIYNLPKPNSPADSPPVVGIISLAGSFRLSDVEDYWSKVCHLDTWPKVSMISIDGAHYTWGDDPDSDIENTLDIEIIGGVFPNCNIVVYSAPNTDTGFYNAISAAIHDVKNRPSVLSISWGAPEDESCKSVLLAISQLFANAVARGINIIVASGDGGSGDGEKGIHVDFPASSPFVTACGGTTLKCPSNVYEDKRTQEVAWSWRPSYQWGTGGGLSSLFPVPWYQKDLQINGLPHTQKGTKLDKRAIPDISGVADPRTPIAIYFDGKMDEIGGTSTVAPFVAAFVASLQTKEFFTEKLYQARKVPGIFHDIIRGSNPLYKAAEGYNCVCGCGTLDGTAFSQFLSGFFQKNANRPTLRPVEESQKNKDSDCGDSKESKESKESKDSNDSSETDKTSEPKDDANSKMTTNLTRAQGRFQRRAKRQESRLKRTDKRHERKRKRLLAKLEREKKHLKPDTTPSLKSDKQEPVTTIVAEQRIEPLVAISSISDKNYTPVDIPAEILRSTDNTPSPVAIDPSPLIKASQLLTSFLMDKFLK